MSKKQKETRKPKEIQQCTNLQALEQKQLTGQGVKGRIRDVATRCDPKQNK
jgi:hypothetical protein